MSNKISAAEWTKFAKSRIGEQIMSDLAALKQANLDFAMSLPDKTAMPNETIAAYVNRAKGIQIVIDNIEAKVKSAEMAKMQEADRRRD